MKKKVLFAATASILLISLFGSRQVNSSPQTNEKEIKVVCTSDISLLAEQWTHQFDTYHPELKVNLQVIEPKQLSQVEEEPAGQSLYIVTDECVKWVQDKNRHCIPLAHEIYVLIYNKNNPYFKQINSKGITTEKLNSVLSHPDKNGWEIVAGTDGFQAVTYYHIDRMPAKHQIADFWNTEKVFTEGKAYENCEEMMAAVQSDRNALALCRLTDLMDTQDQAIPEQIVLLPIDRNANGKLDYFEQFYDNVTDFNRAVWLGKYPRLMVGNIYAVSTGPVSGESQQLFLKWLLTDGQNNLHQNEYSALSSAERRSQIDNLESQKAAVGLPEESDAGYETFLIILAGLFLLGIIVNYFYRKIREKRNEREPLPARSAGVLNEENLEIPDGIYYDKTHTWAFMEQNGNVKIGIDDFLQRVSGAYTKVKIKNTGERIKKDEELLTLVQDGKQLVIKSPISGTISQLNSHVLSHPSLINSSPYGKGWILTIEPSNWMREIQFMKMAANYREWLRTELSRLKDFMAAYVNTSSTDQKVAFQDGGELQDNLLTEFGPHVWEDFQKKFIETTK